MADVVKGAELVGWTPRVRKRRRNGSSESQSKPGTGTETETGGSSEENRETGRKEEDGKAGNNDNNLMKMQIDGLRPWFLSNVGKTLRKSESNMKWLFPGGDSNGFGLRVPFGATRPWTIPPRMMMAP